MSVSHTLTHILTDRTGVAKSCQETVSGLLAIEYDVSVAAGASNVAVADFPALTQASLQSVGFYLSAGATGTVTIKTNSSGSPQDTIPLTCPSTTLAQVLLWTLQINLIAKCPFSGNVTTMFVSNSSASAITLSIRIITN
jgi:hypothetical protein